MRIFRGIFFAVLILLLVGFCAPVAADTTLREYWNTGGDGDSSGICGSNWTLMYFTADDESHGVTSIRIPLKRVGSPGTVTISVARFYTDTETIGTDMASATYDGDVLSTSYSWIPFDVDDTSLSEGYTYAVIVRAVAGDTSNYVLWQADLGGGLAEAIGFYSTDSGVTWSSAAPVDYLFEVYGGDLIEIYSANVFTGFREDDDLLLTIFYTNRYVPYYPLDDSSSYFALRLYDTDGTTLLASTPLTQWGNKPASIYLSESAAANLTLGNPYVVKIINTTDASIMDFYTLVSADWKGIDLTNLDKWIRNTATAMESEYGVEYLVAVISKGDVLNDEGGVIFEAGIPGLMHYRPSMFKTYADTLATNDTLPADAFSPSKDWEVSLGPELKALADDAGDLIGLSGRSAALAGVMLFFLAVSLVLLAKGQFAAGAVAAFPITLGAMELGILTATYVGVIMFILATIFIWQVWWSRT